MSDQDSNSEETLTFSGPGLGAVWLAICVATLAGLLIATIFGFGGLGRSQTSSDAPPAHPVAAPQIKPLTPAEALLVEKLEGTYTVTWELYDLAKALGDRWNDAELYDGTLTVTIHGDDFWFNGLCHGKSVITRDRIVVRTTRNPDEWDCGAGRGAAMVDAHWTVHRDTLQLTDWTLSQLGPRSLDWNLSVVLGLKPLQLVDPPSPVAAPPWCKASTRPQHANC